MEGMVDVGSGVQDGCEEAMCLLGEYFVVGDLLLCTERNKNKVGGVAENTRQAGKDAPCLHQALAI